MIFTPDPAIIHLLDTLLQDTKNLLGKQFVGLYLHGSLAAGGFDPLRSDIDFMTATQDELTESWCAPLQQMHTQHARTLGKWAHKIEGSYISQAALQRYDPCNAEHIALSVEGDVRREYHGSAWIIQMWVLREHGIALAGPQLQDLMEPIGQDDLRQAARGTLMEWWAPKLEDPSYIKTREYQAYTILTMCRILYTVQNGEVVPKAQAARWAQRELGSQWQGCIERALDYPRGEQFDELTKVLEFIQLTLEKNI